MRRFGLALAAVFVVLLGAAIWRWLRPEAVVTWWHLRHGSSFVFQDIRIRVPFTYYVDCRGARCGIVPTNAFRRRFGFDGPACPAPEGGAIWLRPQSQGADLDAQRRRDSELRGRFLEFVSTRKATFAGDAILCDEYVAARAGSYVIFCYRDDAGPVPSYVGTPDSTKEFYTLLESAHRVTMR